MKIAAPAKLNLFLHITGKYENGYHKLESLFAFCKELYDEIEITKADQLSVEVVHSPFPEGHQIKSEDNLLYKILKFLNLNFSIKLTKNIPIGSGLGGSSCDAGALLNYLLDDGYIQNSDLGSISKFGADIIPCMQKKSCFGVGIGDEIIAHPKLPKLYAIIVKPNFSISTMDIYKKSVSSYKPATHIDSWDLSNIRDFKQFITDKTNSLLEPILFFHPEIKGIISYLSKLKNCFYASVSGSGSCCFALFENYEDASNAKDHIRIDNKFFGVYLSKLD